VIANLGLLLPKIWAEICVSHDKNSLFWHPRRKPESATFSFDNNGCFAKKTFVVHQRENERAFNEQIFANLFSLSARASEFRLQSFLAETEGDSSHNVSLSLLRSQKMKLRTEVKSKTVNRNGHFST